MAQTKETIFQTFTPPIPQVGTVFEEVALGEFATAGATGVVVAVKGNEAEIEITRPAPVKPI
ncbi:MAG: hypothetical protein WAV40_05295 [Microgenomates group bacterium]